MSSYSQELHKTYQMTISAFENSYPQSNKDLMKQIDNYSRACALYLWSSLSVDIDQCVEAINCIYSSTAGRIEYTKTNVQSAIKKLSSRSHSMSVPKFFHDIIAYDMKKRTNISRRLAACFQLLDICYAMIDENVQEEEADIIAVLQKELIKECDNKRIVAFQKATDPHKFVTRSNEEKLFVTARKPGEAAPIAREKKKENKTAEITAKQAKNSSLNSPMDELEALIGLTKAKQEIHEISDFVKVQKARHDQGLPNSDVSFHLVFTGNPGTGKTTVARLVARIYKDLGIVSQGHLTEVSVKDLVAGYVGQTAIKTSEVIEKSLGGVLFIDEAYTLLDKSGQGFGQEAIDTLLKEMEDKRDDFVVIVAGYDELMHDFINSNPGLKSRFNKYIHFDDYTADEMCDIFGLLCSKGAYEVSDDAKELIRKYFSAICATKAEGFANGRTARNMFENIISKQASRIALTKGQKTKELLSTIEAEDVEKCVGKMNEDEKLEDVLKEFNSLTGLDRVKEEITELVYIVRNQQRRQAQGLKVPSLSLHLVFMGNPGTGKTTVARCVAKIYKCMGLLSKGQLIETDRSGLVAGYVGQTAMKTQDVIQTAIGGVLFVDEAYTLVNGGPNDFGQEAIDTLLKAMEDQRDDLVVIVAGYDNLMNDFIHSNPGLESRFNRYIHFEDYTAAQMLSIFNRLCSKNQYILSDDASERLKLYFEEIDISKIGNGRGARNLFEKVVTQQAKRIERLSEKEVDLQKITAEDIDTAIRRG